jgi:hypothetical protein
MFRESTRSTILTYVFIGSTKTCLWKMLNFTKIFACPFYPIPCFTFKLSIHLPSAVILSTFSWKSGGGKHIFTYNFLPPLLHLCTLTISWLQGRASTGEICFKSLLSLCSDEWLVMSYEWLQVPCAHYYISAVFWSSANWTGKHFYFIF